MRRLVVGVAILGLAACWLGCGGGDYSSPKATFETARAALKAGNRDAFLACLDDPSKKGMSEILAAMDEASSVSAEMKKEMASKDIMKEASEEFEKATIGAEKITGDTATLEITHDGKPQTLNFVKEPSGWRLKPPGPPMKPEMVKMAVEMIRGAAKAAKEAATKK